MSELNSPKGTRNVNCQLPEQYIKSLCPHMGEPIKQWIKEFEAFSQRLKISCQNDKGNWRTISLAVMSTTMKWGSWWKL